MSATFSSAFEVDKDGMTRPLSLRNGDKGRWGASGTVFELESDPGKAIKIYHEEERTKFEAKIRTMIKVKYNRPNADQFDLAWPETAVVDTSGTFLGFKMPFLGANWVDLESLMQASEAENKYGMGERGRLAIGANLAMAVGQLHAIRMYCIDLKPQNVRVNLNKTAVGIIDCDGMSVVDIETFNGRRFFADKCTPEFWAPENMGLKPDAFKDEEAHDRFALATIVFMLLNRGIHPYQGILTFDIPGTETTAGKIKNHLYPYGAERGKITGHRDSLYPFWPKETRDLFDQAFSPAATRPSAEQWRDHLSHLQGEVEVCPRNPQLHVRYPEVGCPFCMREARAPLRQPRATGQATGGSAQSFMPSFANPQAHSPGAAALSSPSIPPFPDPPSSSFRGPAVRAAMILGFVGIVVFGAVALNTRSSPTNVSDPTGGVVTVSNSPPARCAQEVLYVQAAQSGAQGLRQYIGECQPLRGTFVQQAKNTLEAIAYNDAVACIRSSCGVDICLSTYGVQSLEGTGLAALRNQAQSRRVSEACDAAAAERAVWLRTVNARSVDALRQYLNQYPSGVHAGEARQRIAQADDGAWNQALRDAGVDGPRRYLAVFPNGAHTAEAQQRIALLEAIYSKFDLRANVEITSNSPYNTQIFAGGRGVENCAIFCSRNSGCRAFTSDNYSCRIYNLGALTTAGNGNWRSGFRR